MARTSRPPFLPHAYATYLSEAGTFARDGGLIYSWTGSHWRSLDEDDAIAEAYQWLLAQGVPTHVSPENARRAYNAARLFLPALPAVTQKCVLPLMNGYLHIDDEGIRLADPDPALGLQYGISCAYDPTATAPRFEKFLERALPDPAVRARVQEYVGYTLLPDSRFQVGQLWLGEGANGKGVLANLVQELHGKVAAVQLNALEGFKLSGLIGASLVYCDEVPRGKIDEQLLKSLIAGERVSVDRKYKDAISICVRGKWLLLGNHLPTVTDHSTGFWRRWDLVPFGATVPVRERDPRLLEKLRMELAGVLNWALAGLQRLLARGGFDPELPRPMADLLSGAKAETSSVAAWVADAEAEVQVGGPFISKNEVYAGYKSWCATNTMGAYSSMKFWTELYRILPELQQTDSRRRIKGNLEKVVQLRFGLLAAVQATEQHQLVAQA